MKLNEVTAKQILVKSNLPASDYVANPYVGCTHNCRYCYASFMKRFTGHTEEWGTFLDVKSYERTTLPRNLTGKTVLLSSVTDPYNPYERTYHKSRELLEMLSRTDANVEILSKSDLMLHDIELLKKMPRLTVGISLCTLDDEFRRLIEPGAPSVERRLHALSELHKSGIATYLFISPIFPRITEISAICEAVRGSVDKICFENLNLRGGSKQDVLALIDRYYPQYSEDYTAIYRKGDISYWKDVEKEIEKLSEAYDIPFVNFFYHDKIKKGGHSND